MRRGRIKSMEETKIRELWRREAEIQNAIENLNAVIQRKAAAGEDVEPLRSIVGELDESCGKLLIEIDDLRQAEFCKETDVTANRLVTGELNSVAAVAGILAAFNKRCGCAAEIQQEV